MRKCVYPSGLAVLGGVLAGLAACCRHLELSSAISATEIYPALAGTYRLVWRI